jgi:simple sugar transport system substrate-binding protein
MSARSRLSRIIALTSVFAVLLPLAACGAKEAPAQQNRLRIAVITEWDGGSFWSVVKAGAQKAAKDLDVELIFSTAEGNPERQAQLISSAITMKVDGIALSAANPDAIKGAVQEAHKAGIPVVTLNSGAEQAKALGALTHVGQTETVAGVQAGKRLAETGATKLLCVNGESGNVGQVQRCEGARQGFGRTFESVAVSGSGDVATTLTEIESKLRADPGIDAVLTLNPDIAIAARDAIKGAGSKAKLATFDLSKDVLSAIRESQVSFAIDQQPYLQGYLPITLLNLFHDNRNIVGGGSPVLTGPAFVDQTNVDAIEKLVSRGTR